MTEKHLVRFEPVGIEIEVSEDQNILRAAAEQGIMLMHGCKEGQCASCKSFVLDGDEIELDKYSTFALPDYELEEGYTLLCRAHAYEDLTIELLNYDEEMIRSGLPIQQGVAEVVSKDAVTHDMRHLVLRLIEPDEIKFFPGQYMDIAIPAPTRCVPSRWPTPPAGRAGCWSSSSRSTGRALLQVLAEKMAEGDRLDMTGPFGVFTLREGDNDLVFVGGGAGMAPIFSLLRAMAERGLQRKATFFYGARTKEGSLLRARAAQAGAAATGLPVHTGPVRAGYDQEWDGETGLITDVVKRHASDLRGAHAYVCGPPPMVEAALPLLATLGVEEKRIYYDKFTTTGNPQE